MRSSDIVLSGLGVTTAVAQGKNRFLNALLAGEHAFGELQRPGRDAGTRFLGAEIRSLQLPDRFDARKRRTWSWPAEVAIATLDEAWGDANLGDVDPTRIGLIVGGTNLQLREAALLREAHADRPEFVRPTYGVSFLDTDLCGICTENYAIRGQAMVVGGASASGQLAVIQAVQAIESGALDVCIALGALTDLSHWECQALRSLGAMGSDRFAKEPALACRPFDSDRDGFIYGESCAAVVVESRAYAAGRKARMYAQIDGWGISIDGNRNPNPSAEGEMAAIAAALKRAGVAPREIDYVNPHATGSVLGDETELLAIRESGLSRAFLSATKSITGHGLSAAGAVEVVATALQMNAGRLHPSRNLDRPLDSSANWVGPNAIDCRLRRALTLSNGFGGINTALCLRTVN